MDMQAKRSAGALIVIAALSVNAIASEARAENIDVASTGEATHLVDSGKKTTNVPEPTQLALLAIGGVLTMCRRRRR